MKSTSLKSSLLAAAALMMASAGVPGARRAKYNHGQRKRGEMSV